MKPSLLDVPFPLKGLVVNVAKDKQPPMTAAAAVNVRGYDPVAGRDRGGQRSGMTKYCPTPINGATAIQDINHLATTLATPPGSSAGQVVYTPAGNNAVALANAAGTQIATTGAGTQQMHCACWDTAGNVYVAVPTSSTHLTIYKLSAAGVQSWLTAPIADSAAIQAIGMATDGTYLYVNTYSSAANYGLPVWKVLCADGSLVGGTYWYKSSDTTLLQADLVTSNNSLAYGAGHLAICYGDKTVAGVHYGACEIINVNTLGVDGSVTLNSGGPIPFVDVCTDGYGTFYVLGVNTGTATGALVKIIPNVSTLSVTSGALSKASGICFDPIGKQLAVCFSATGGPGNNSLATYSLAALTIVTSQKPGALFWNTVQPSGSGGFVLWRTNAANNLMGVAADLITATWGPSTLSEVTTVKSVISTNTVPLVSPIASLGQIRPLAVAGGTITRFNSSGPVSISGGAALNPGVPVIFSTQLQQKMYYADGGTYLVYDAATDAVTTLAATSGSLPIDAYGYTGRLLCTWRQRLVVAGLPLDASNWFMSAVGDPTNWNYAPAPAVETQAVAGNNSSTSTGQSPDVINCLIPYNDEILLMGGDHTIYQLTGDPASGGRIDLVTDQVGMAYGQPWCRDGQGVIYFLSSRGSVYRFVPGALPERMSDPISELLTGTIDFSTTIARMAWDERQLGFHLFLTKQGGAAAATHYFWDQRNEAWWQDVYANNNHNPLAVHALQGFTAADRIVLIGGQDGYIRCVDCAAKDDDGTAIASSVTIGPIKDKNAVGLTIIDLQADLDTVSDAVSYAIIRGNDAQTAIIAPALFSGTFSAGRNRSQAVRAHGHATYIVLSSNTIAKRWALEYLRCKVLAAEGTDRQRMFIST